MISLELVFTDVVDIIEVFEQNLLVERDAIEQKAQEVFETGDNQAARDLISNNVKQRLLDSLRLGMALTEEVEAETRERFGIREPEGRDEPGETTPPASQGMAEGTLKDIVHCYDNDLHADYLREHGAYTDASPSNHGRRTGLLES